MTIKVKIDSVDWLMSNEVLIIAADRELAELFLRKIQGYDVDAQICAKAAKIEIGDEEDEEVEKK